MEALREGAPIQAELRARVVVRFANGLEQTYDAVRPVEIQMNSIVIYLPKGGHVGISLRCLESWEFTLSPLAIVGN